MYLNWGNSKYIPIIQNKHYIPLVLLLIWKDPKELGKAQKTRFFSLGFQELGKFDLKSIRKVLLLRILSAHILNEA